jgi:RNA polymerase sigma factor (sigma-70 family)
VSDALIALSLEQQSLANSMLDRVKPMAGWMHKKHPSVDYDELESACQWGVVLSVQRHRPELGSFERFAVTTMRLEMKNAVRKFLGRRLRESARASCDFDGDSDDEPATADGLEASINRSPHHDRIDILRNQRLRAAHAVLVTFSEGGEDEHLARRQYASAYRVLDDVVERLPPDQRTFYLEFYRKGATLEEVAAMIGKEVRATRRVGDRVREAVAEALFAARVV